MLNWLQNLSILQKVLVGALIIIGVAGGYWILNPILFGGQITLPPVFQRFFGGPYEDFIQKWDEAVEISSEFTDWEVPYADIPAGAGCAAVSAAIIAHRPVMQEYISGIDRQMELLDEFDPKISEAEAAGNGLANSEAKGAAGKLVGYARDWSDAFRDFLPPAKQAAELYLARLNNHPGCVDTLESVAAAMAYEFESIVLVGEILNPHITSLLAAAETLVVDSSTAHQEWQEATGITVRPIGSISREQLEDLLQE